MGKASDRYPIDQANSPISEPLGESFQILALSGGGYRGLFTAAILENLEQEGGPLRDRFDLITGTSIGSILAGALSVGIPATDILQGMIANGEKIFPSKGRLGAMVRGGKRLALDAPYKSEPLENAIAEILASKAKISLIEIPKALAIPCVSHTRAELKVLRSRGLAGSASNDVTLVDAMLASAAAPTYFPSRQLITETVVDGGMIANAPEMVGVSDAIHMKGAKLADIRVLSIGTASSSLARPPEEAGAPSILGWMVARELFQVAMQATEQMAQRQCEMLIGDRYLRLDKSPEPKQAAVIGLDKADNVATKALLDLARARWDERTINEKTQIANILRHRC